MARGRLRSLVIVAAAFFVGALSIVALLLSQSAHTVLERSADRLGADVIVVSPQSKDAVDKTLLMEVPTDQHIARSSLEAVATVPGVEKVSPQLFLATILGADCCEDQQMRIVVYDPSSDFAVGPWLKGEGLAGLKTGEVVGGSKIFSPLGDGTIKLYGTDLNLVGNLEKTGTGLDATLYMTWDTAEVMAGASEKLAVTSLVIPDDEVSALLVKIAAGVVAQDVATDIWMTVEGVNAFGRSEVFSGLRNEGRAMQIAVLAFAAVVAVMAIVLVVVVATFSVRERRREVGVLRALGATRSRVVTSLTSSSAVLSLAGAILGTLVTLGVAHLFGSSLQSALESRFVLPGAGETLPYLVAVIIGVTLIVTAASALPILRLSTVDPAEQMRERA